MSQSHLNKNLTLTDNIALAHAVTFASARTTLMSRVLRLISKLPLPRCTRLAWQWQLLDRAYGQDIAAARKAKDKVRIQSLEFNWRYEIDMLEEEENARVTQHLLKKAYHLRVPVPHRYNEDNSESEHWYEGQYYGWYLTNRGIASLREEIRRELKARHEVRAQWVVWVSALTGLVGTITGLIALLTHKAP